MAKATEKDMEAALAMCRALESLEKGYLPDEMTEGQEETVWYDENEHAAAVIKYLVVIQNRASIFRVCFGMTVLLDPQNEIVDQSLTYLELHPRLLLCKAACEGIPDDKLQSWLNPPEGQLGAPHGTWAAQLAAAGNQLVEMQRKLDELLAAAEKLLPFLSTQGEMLDAASLNDGRASEFDMACVAMREIIAKVGAPT